jgi:hypothetical protein
VKDHNTCCINTLDKSNAGDTAHAAAAAAAIIWLLLATLMNTSNHR